VQKLLVRASSSLTFDIYTMHLPATVVLATVDGQVARADGLEYRRRSPQSRKRQQEGNRVSGSITGRPSSWGK
jgi:hypothetical protein